MEVVIEDLPRKQGKVLKSKEGKYLLFASYQSGMALFGALEDALVRQSDELLEGVAEDFELKIVEAFS